MIPTIKPRPSSMDRAMLCPGSHFPKEGEPLIDVIGDEDASEIGRAVHFHMSQYVQHAQAPEGIEGFLTMEELAAKFKVEADQIRFLCYAARQGFDTIAAMFDVDKWESEKRLRSDEIADGFWLEGTTDLIGIAIDRATLVIADLKTGMQKSHEHQLRSYAKAAVDSLSREGVEIENVIALIVWARDFDIQKFEYSRADLGAWSADVVSTLLEWDGINYAVGDHCTYCPRNASCDARDVAVRAGYRLMTLEMEDAKNLPSGPDVARQIVLTGKDFAAAWEASKLIPKMVEQWRDRIRERIVATGPIDLGDGKILAVVEQNSAPFIDTKKAASVLKSGFGFGDGDVLDCCQILKGAIEDKVKSSAPRGQKGKRVEAAVNAMIEHGALIPRVGLRFAVKDATEHIEGKEGGGKGHLEKALDRKGDPPIDGQDVPAF